MIRLPTIALLLAVTACGSEPSPARRHAATAPAIPAATDSQRAADSPRVRIVPPAHPAGYLVWWADSAHSARTAWLDGGGRVIATRPGVYAAMGPHLWRWTEGTKRAPGADCECIRGKDPDRCPLRSSRVNTATMVDLAGGGTREIMGPLDSTQASGEVQPEQQATPVTGAGPYLLVRVKAAYDACGAHGLPADDVAWAPLAGDTVPEPEASVMARDSAAATLGFLQTPCGIGEDDEKRDPGSPWSWEAQWTRGGRLQGGYRFIREAAFICGDGGESYSRTILVADSVLPRWIAAWSPAPEPVRRYWSTEPRAAAAWREAGVWASDTSVAQHSFWYMDAALRAGWSAVDSVNAPRLLALFRTR
ncbi:hypothetical protein [Longimicrobium sp.]|uniref:hypothetical protein n=1 Tax=Longimicrobium sp. TaxID=2029185 RepID=UPI002C5035E6|nr:hypothetical protein [Longimicrobium sp.]HSU17249.1 hypothetical protein [Longimicrobium sp.]